MDNGLEMLLHQQEYAHAQQVLARIHAKTRFESGRVLFVIMYGSDSRNRTNSTKRITVYHSHHLKNFVAGDRMHK